MNLPTLCSAFNIELMILFGSRARAAVTDHSDYDIAVKFVATNSKPDLLSLILKLEQLYPGMVDLTVLSMMTDSLLLREVAAGKLLYEKHAGLFSEFQALAWKVYIDDRWLRDREYNWLMNFQGDPIHVS